MFPLLCRDGGRRGGHEEHPHHVHMPPVDRAHHRRVVEAVADVDVGVGAKERFDDVVVVVLTCLQQRRLAIVAAGIDPGTGGEQLAAAAEAEAGAAAAAEGGEGEGEGEVGGEGGGAGVAAEGAAEGETE